MQVYESGLGLDLDASDLDKFCKHIRVALWRRFYVAAHHHHNQLDYGHYVIQLDRWYKLKRVTERSSPQVKQELENKLLLPLTKELKSRKAPKNVSSRFQQPMQELVLGL